MVVLRVGRIERTHLPHFGTEEIFRKDGIGLGSSYDESHIILMNGPLFPCDDRIDSQGNQMAVLNFTFSRGTYCACLSRSSPFLVDIRFPDRIGILTDLDPL